MAKKSINEALSFRQFVAFRIEVTFKMLSVLERQLAHLTNKQLFCGNFRKEPSDFFLRASVEDVHEDWARAGGW